MTKIMDPFNCGLELRNDYNFAYIDKKLAQNIIKNDVFLNQDNHQTEDIRLEDLSNRIFNDNQSSLLMDEHFEDESNRFERFLDDLCAEESENLMANHSIERLFGCVCCDSCQLKSKEFMNKTNEVLNKFKKQLNELKNSVRQQLSHINTQMNETRVKFAKLLVDLQIKLNKKNFQLEKILDISSVLQQTNDFLLTDNKDIKIKFENVSKQNIHYKSRLGIDLKVVLNPNDCHNYLKQMQLKSRLIDTTIEAVIKDNNKNPLIKNEVIEDVTELSSVPQLKRAVVLVSPLRPKRSRQKAGPLSRTSPQASNSATNCVKPCTQSSSKELPNVRKTILLTDLKTYSKVNNNFRDDNNSNIKVSKQEIETNIRHILKKYQINNCINNGNIKKRRIDEKISDSPPKNNKIEDKTKPQKHLKRNQSSGKELAENKDRNK